MKITRKVEIEVTLTPDEIEQAIVNALPKRFKGKYFVVNILEDGSAVAVSTEDE